MKADNGNGGNRPAAAAPFVLKTYKMVNDPETDGLIAWGRENNSFVVVDSFGFAQRLLPSHFKHNNFSSFVRQLNTYGFRKVDPDLWEFAHESFLRGQTHLLHHIVRRNHGHSNKSYSYHGKEGEGVGGELDDDESMVLEVVKLKQEQKAAQEELQSMWKRVQETERKPKQMLAFLVKVVQNPELIPLLRQSHTSAAEELRLRSITGNNSSYAGNNKKRGRLMISSSASSSSTASDEWADGQDMLGLMNSQIELGRELGSRKSLAVADPLGGGGAAAAAAATVPVLPAGDAMELFGSPSLFVPDFGSEMEAATGSYPMSFSACGGFY